MPERITKLQRWLDLIAYLVGRRLPVTVEEIMEHVPAYARKWNQDDDRSRDTARRMFERDKDELRRAGIPIHTVPYVINHGRDQIEGYQITRRDFYLPYLEIVSRATTSERDGYDADLAGARPARTRTNPAAIARAEIDKEDARTALEALTRVAGLPGFPFAREARSAFRKLAFDLDPEVFRGAPVLFVERPGAAEVSDRVRRISAALLARKRLRFRYHGVYRGEETQRDVAPYGLLFQHGHWYLFAHDADRGAVRAFRADRMDDVVANTTAPHTPDFEVPPDFRLDDYVDRQPWELGDEKPITARALFRFPRSLWAERNGHGKLVEQREDGCTVREFEVHQVNPFLRWLLSLVDEVELLEPPELVAELRSLARDTAAVYGHGDVDG